jgi:hypothetical protein
MFIKPPQKKKRQMGKTRPRKQQAANPPSSTLALAKVSAATVLVLPVDVLKLVLDAACGSSANRRFLFLATCKLLYADPGLWGTEFVVRPGHPFRRGWLSERKSITDVWVTGSSEVWPESKDFAFLCESKMRKLEVELWFTQGPKKVTWLWEALGRFLLAELVMKNYRGSLGGLRKALPELRRLDCTGVSGGDHNLECLRGMKLTHLRLNSPELGSLAGLEGMPLVVLDVSHCHHLENLGALAETKLAELAELDLTFCTSLDPSVALGIAGMPLVRLSLKTYVHPIPKEAIVAMGATLRHLDLSICTDVSDELLLAIRGLRLETLQLAFCSSISALGVAHLAPMSATLKLLDLRNSGVRLEDCPPQLRSVIRL